MGYDIVDAYEDIKTLSNNFNALVLELQEKGVIEKPKEKK